MSAAKTKRVKHDAYLTPDRLAQALVAKTAHIILGRGEQVASVLEPSAGEGAFVRGLYDHFTEYPRPRIQAVEPRAAAIVKLQERTPARVALHHMTFEQWATQRAAEPEVLDLIIGNPPFSRAEQHIALARKHARYVAFLLRLSMLGSQRRAQTLWSTPGLLAVVPLAQRPVFIRPGKKKKKGTDNSEYGLFVWRHGYSGDAVLHRPLVLDNPKKRD